MKPYEFKEFTKEDWYGYAGASVLKDGTQPRITEIETEFGVTISAIISGSEESKTDLEITYLYPNEEGDSTVFNKEYAANLSLKAIMIDVEETMDTILNDRLLDLSEIGFQQLM